MKETRTKISAPPISGEIKLYPLMKQKGYNTIQELADAMHIERASLSRSLNGNPNYAMLYRIAEALGVTISDLFVSSQPKQPAIYGCLCVNGESRVVNSKEDLIEVINELEINNNNICEDDENKNPTATNNTNQL